MGLMTPFDEIEQLTTDLTWFACDSMGRIGHFTTGTQLLLPQNISKSKEILDKLNNYFDNLPALQEKNYEICPDLSSHLDRRLAISHYDYILPSAEMSARGLYSYDNHPMNNERSYYRVTIPKRELLFDDLPEDIKIIFENLKISEVNFAENSLISRNITDKLG